MNDDDSDEEEYVDKRRRNKPPTSSGISEEDREKILQMVENEADVIETQCFVKLYLPIAYILVLAYVIKAP